MAPDGVMPLPDLRDLAKKSRTKDRQKEVTQVRIIGITYTLSGIAFVCRL